MPNKFRPLDSAKAAQVNPFSNADDYDPGAYLAEGTKVSVVIESREQEMAILAAYDYGLDALSEQGKHQIDRLIADLKFAITGR
jgi:hypothetical protein